MPSNRTKRELSKGDVCKALELGSKGVGMVTNIAGDISSIPVIGEAASIVTAGVSLVGHVVKNVLDIAQTAKDCADIPFDEIKEIVNNRFNVEERRLDQNNAALHEVSKLASQTLKNVDTIRKEMHEDFMHVMEAIESNKVDDVVTKINNFVRFFATEKEIIVGLPQTEFVAKLEQDEFLNLLRDSRSLKTDSLRNLLFKIMEEGLAIPSDTEDKIALKALYALYYGTHTYVSVMFFLIKKYTYLADYYYEKGRLDKYNQYFEKVKLNFQDFRHTLIGSKTDFHKPLIDNVIQVLETVKNKYFILDKTVHSNRIEALIKLKKEIKDMKLPLILAMPENTIKTAFRKSDVSTPIGDWKPGSMVSYAIQFTDDKRNHSKVSEWTDPFKVHGKACPHLKLPVDPQRRIRLIFRKIDNNRPQLIATIDPHQTEFRDINRDLYNSAGTTDEKTAKNEVDTLLKAGADTNASFEKGRKVIHATARQGNSNVAETLLLKQHKIDVNTKDKDGYTPLHIAAIAGSANLVKKLLEKQANVNVKTESHQFTALHFAALFGFEDTVQKLMESLQINVNEKDKHEFTPLHNAIMGGLNVVNLFLKHPKIDVNAKSKVGLTPLHLASMNNDKKVVDALLSHNKVDINAKDSYNLSPLHLVSLMGNLEAAQSLISHANINVNLKTTLDKWSPLHYAIFFKKSNVAEALLKATNIDVNSLVEGVSPLHLAIATGQSNVVSALLSKSASTQHPTSDGYLALHVAALRKEENIAQLLIESGVSVSAKTSDNSTALHLAASAGRLKTVMELIKKGADVNAQNNDKNTPLHLAAEGGHFDVVSYLTNNGANAVIPNHDNLLPIYLAVRNGYLDIVKYLIENRKVDVEAKDELRDNNPYFKNSIAHWAVCDAIKYGKLDMVKYLVGDLSKKKACDPVFTAVEHGQMDILKYLVDEKHLAVNRPYNGSDKPPIIEAIEKDNFEMVKYLVQRKADVKAEYRSVDCMGTAIDMQNIHIVRFLAENGFDINFKDEDSNTLLHYAIVNKPLTVYFALEKRLNVHALNNDGNTALHLAAQFGDEPTVEFLCKMGIDKTMKNKQKKTAYDLAQGNPRTKQSKCLRPKTKRRSAEKTAYDGISNEFIVPSDVTTPKNPAVHHSSEKSGKNGASRALNPHEVFEQVENMSKSKSSENAVIDSMDVNGILLLLDVLIRKKTGQNYIYTEDRSISTPNAQVAALNITEKFEELLNTVSNVPAEELIDLSQFHRNIYKAVMSGNQSKISQIICSQLKEYSLLEPQNMEKLVAAFMANEPVISRSNGQVYDKLPGLLSQVCLGPNKVHQGVLGLK